MGTERLKQSWEDGEFLEINPLNPTLDSQNIACPCCAESVVIPSLQPGEEAHCPTCSYVLARVDRQPYALPLAFALSALIVSIIVSFSFFMRADGAGVNSSFSMYQIQNALFSQDYGFLAIIMIVFVFATPLLYLLSCLYVYFALITQKKLWLLLHITRFMFRLVPWLMVDIFFISTLVALVKIKGLADVEFGVAFFALFLYSVLLIRTVLATPKHWVYTQIVKITSHSNHIEMKRTENSIACLYCFFYQDKHLSHCSVCAHKLSYRREHSLQKSWAFLIAAIILYIPANTLPMMITSSPMSSLSSGIIDGVFVLWNSGDKLIALIIFVASVAVPIIKILVLLVLLVNTHAKTKLYLKPITLSHLYHFIERIGRWSMVDVYVIILLMAVFNTPLAEVKPGSAVVYFCLVVILTMIATHYFDVRLIWDKARKEQNNDR